MMTSYSKLTYVYWLPARFQRWDSNATRRRMWDALSLIISSNPTNSVSQSKWFLHWWFESFITGLVDSVKLMNLDMTCWDAVTSPDSSGSTSPSCLLYNATIMSWIITQTSRMSINTSPLYSCNSLRRILNRPCSTPKNLSMSSLQLSWSVVVFFCFKLAGKWMCLTKIGHYG